MTWKARSEDWQFADAGKEREEQHAGGGLHLHDAGERGANMARQGRRTRHGAAVVSTVATGKMAFLPKTPCLH